MTPKAKESAGKKQRIDAEEDTISIMVVDGEFNFLPELNRNKYSMEYLDSGRRIKPGIYKLSKKHWTQVLIQISPQLMILVMSPWTQWMKKTIWTKNIANPNPLMHQL